MTRKHQIILPFPITVIIGIVFILLPLELIGFRLNARKGATIAEQISINIVFYTLKTLFLLFNIFCIYEIYY